MTTPTNFKEARAQHARTGPFLNTDHFAEQVTYTPVHGGGSRTVTVKIEYVKNPEERTQIGEVDREEIWVKALRSTDTDRSGIPTPETGDAILRDGDRPDRPWTFQGPIRHETPHDWQLFYARTRPSRYGPRDTH
ncbi:MAG TPA: hypothetical protein VMY42_28380 [Thermoguttaceae bacterium]|nr:hypothetical protein [Thermoguttaceae bacterium]